MKTLFLLAGLTALLSGGAVACDMRVSISGGGYEEDVVLPGKAISLTPGTAYTLTVHFTEDHRNCKIPPEDTLFLLNDERWKTGKDYLPLVMTSTTGWIIEGTRDQHISFAFVAGAGERAVFAIERECPKGGFHESYTFRLS